MALSKKNKLILRKKSKPQKKYKRVIQILFLIALLLGTFLLLGNVKTIQDIRQRAAENSQIEPTDYLRAFTGGNNIAILWDPLPDNASVSTYILYKDGKEIVKVNPVPKKEKDDSGTLRYYDKNVKEGQTYKYEVAAIVDRKPSKKSSLTVTHEQCTPVPNITMDTSQAPDLVEYGNTVIKPLIETWYSKVSGVLASPEYDPPTSFTIKINPQENPGQVEGANPNTILKFDSGFLNKYKGEDPGRVEGLIIHEMTHVIQQYKPGMPGWITEGMATWADKYLFNNKNQSKLTESYTKGYGSAAYFLQWISKKYQKPNLIHDLNVLGHNGKYNDNFFVQQTGKTADQLWKEMTAEQENPAYKKLTNDLLFVCLGGTGCEEKRKLSCNKKKIGGEKKVEKKAGKVCKDESALDKIKNFGKRITYWTQIDADGDGSWDKYTLDIVNNKAVDIYVDIDKDGRADFVGHDYDGDRLVDDAHFDNNSDGKIETYAKDKSGDGWQDDFVPVAQGKQPKNLDMPNMSEIGKQCKK